MLSENHQCQPVPIRLACSAGVIWTIGCRKLAPGEASRQEVARLTSRSSKKALGASCCIGPPSVELHARVVIAVSRLSLFLSEALPTGARRKRSLTPNPLKIHRRPNSNERDMDVIISPKGRRPHMPDGSATGT